ncbi:hypothetical protein L228DRAFT_249460 [Xylona heveae TC161]|uniref:Uncharacterized protein n=1 Tax=Xylona heveae (strain CBS 132557 / TC161) TaxID=1328760 RepID=A0A165F7U3_XYLHT|nr:hypothetical protein L228DRAFT_249460 [Xylona heveae TC161]KZF20676.1 hypothetical protein L228DRAFT_249460 [Xylona heveae TC161]
MDAFTLMILATFIDRCPEFHQDINLALILLLCAHQKSLTRSSRGVSASSDWQA